mmetsp:Transcript_14263/g.61102  ORF Transcript_14263/g.61102 Transcript_14263/m.61102 type:complete len:292 (-) Transcript_14263:2779-3654(-)
MEDADRLLLLALGRVGCSVPANVRSMADVVAANALPAMCASCLRALDASRVSGAAGDGTVSPSAEPYPADAAARIRACEALAARMNALARSLSDAAPEQSSSKRWTCVDLLVPNASAARDACAFLLDAAYAARASAETSVSWEREKKDGENEEDVPSASQTLARVAELTKNVEKQAGETRLARRAARAAAGSLASSRAALARSHALVDASLYRDAVAGDAISKETFKHFTVIHESFERLAANADATWRENAQANVFRRRRERAETVAAETRDVNARLEAILVEVERTREKA